MNFKILEFLIFFYNIKDRILFFLKKIDIYNIFSYIFVFLIYILFKYIISIIHNNFYNYYLKNNIIQIFYLFIYLFNILISKNL